MSALAARVRGWPPGSAPRVADRPAPSGLVAPALELLLFAALAAVAAVQWSRLLAEPPLDRLALAVLAAAVGAGVLALIREATMSARAARFARALAPPATLAAALVAVGLPVELLAPWHWGELREGVRQGLAGIEDVELPYAGPDEWVRLTLLLGAGTLLALAAIAGFLPLRRREAGRSAAASALLALFGTAVTLDSPPGELAWGAGLLLLTGAWLWLPRLARERSRTARSAARAVATLVAATALALPLAAALERDRPWWDYESWDWFGGDRTVSFEWNHSYGPLEWPTEGTTLLEARSERALYWKTAVLDRFDGFTWQRAEPGDPLAAGELIGRQTQPATNELAAAHPEWVSEASFDVRALSSEIAVGAGAPIAVRGLERVLAAPDGTLTLLGAPLESGSGYTVAAYVPQPSPRQMRRAGGDYDPALAGSTLLGLPAGGADPGPAPGAAVRGGGGGAGFGLAPGPALAIPLWGERRGEAATALRASPYAGAFRLARRLSAGAATPFEAARAIESHFRDGTYDYTQAVPERTYPLASFLAEDRAGYCQQFAGTMTLMLRSLGIPSRVVSGFAPGSFDPDSNAYAVRDLDAHAWVEVYFDGLGWVVFDPTPAAAPAASQEVSPSSAGIAAGVAAQGEPSRGRTESLEPAGGRRVESAAVSQGGDAPVALLVLALSALVGLGAGIAYARRRRRLGDTGSAERQARELLAALERFGLAQTRGATLHMLERRYTGVGRAGIARYARALARSRFEPGAPPPPGHAMRRAMRRALAARGGLRARLRALRAVPPGGPRVAR